MTKQEWARRLRDDTGHHYNCAQSVLIPFSAELGLTPEQAEGLAAHFGGGMGCGGACGALTGALMVLGGLGEDRRSELLREFRAAKGAVDCRELLAAAVQAGTERKVHCDELVSFCVDYLCRITEGR